MNKLYVMVGVPASGKSTWIESQEWKTDCCIISTDYWVEQEAKRVGKTYSEVFEDYMPRAVELMTQNVISAREMGNDIIWDQTSTTIATRAKKLRMLPDYYAIAVVFKTPDVVELYRRLGDRPGKVVPPSVVHNMIAAWEEPTQDEGFKEIWYT